MLVNIMNIKYIKRLLCQVNNYRSSRSDDFKLIGNRLENNSSTMMQSACFKDPPYIYCAIISSMKKNNEFQHNFIFKMVASIRFWASPTRRDFICRHYHVIIIEFPQLPYENSITLKGNRCFKSRHT